MPGHSLGNRFVLMQRIGQGGYGEMFTAVDPLTPSSQQIAIKVHYGKSKMKNHKAEVATLKQMSGLIPLCPCCLQLTVSLGTQFFPKFIADGIDGDYLYIAMELLGNNLMFVII